jgi:hypothetical protein
MIQSVNSNKFIPEHLRGITVGDVVVIRREEEIVEEFGPYFHSVRCGWAEGAMGAFAGKELLVNSEAMDRIKEGQSMIWREFGFSWSLDMVKFKEGAKKIETEPEFVFDDESLREISIKITNDEVRETAKREMISMVDMKQFRSVMAVAATYDDKVFPKTEIIKLYLEKWAEAKVDFFLLFGRKLSINKEIDMDIDSVDMGAMIDELTKKYKKYATVIHRFNSEEYIKNAARGYDEVLMKYAPKYERGMKVSKIISAYLEDPEFDIELSKVLQYRTIKGSIKISIEPYDYLTASYNRHGWRSCHSIAGGEYSTGNLDYMIDESTLVAFKENNKLYDYDESGFKWKGNSKSWRQFVFVDKDSCSMIFGKHYPSKSKDTETVVRNLIEETISNYLEIENSYYISSYMPDNAFKSNGTLAYVDLKYSNNFSYVRHKKLKDRDSHVIKICVGEVPCLHCGDPVRTSNETSTCGC